MSEEAVPQNPGVEVERVPVVLGPEEVRGGGVLQVGRRPPQRGVAVGRHAQRVVVVVVVHRLREHQLRVRVQGPALRRLVAVHEGLRGGAGVGVAEEGRGADRLLRGRGGALLAHQGLDGEAAFSRRRRRKHGALVARSPGRSLASRTPVGEKSAESAWDLTSASGSPEVDPPFLSETHDDEVVRGAGGWRCLVWRGLAGWLARAPSDVVTAVPACLRESSQIHPGESRALSPTRQCAPV